MITSLPARLIANMKKHLVWQEQCPVPLNRLKLVTVKFYNFEDIIAQGEIVCFDVVAKNVEKIFDALFSIKFPIAKIRTIENYAGDDEKSMADNNSSCFNYRLIAGSKQISIHSLGMAIDINPVQNPYIVHPHEVKAVIYPPQGLPFIDRHINRKGMITADVIEIFKSNGFTIWGGDWTSPIDYHHFQLPRVLANELIELDFANGTNKFDEFINQF